MDTSEFWVVGGVYADTSFERIVGADGEDWLGPFDTIEAAQKEWARLSWRDVDDCHARYTIVERAGEAAASAAPVYWVTGGEYADTGFESLAPGTSPRWSGPFADLVAAEKEWQRLSWQDVDDCHARYRVVERAEDWQPSGETRAA